MSFPIIDGSVKPITKDSEFYNKEFYKRIDDNGNPIDNIWRTGEKVGIHKVYTKRQFTKIRR